MLASCGPAQSTLRPCLAGSLLPRLRFGTFLLKGCGDLTGAAIAHDSQDDTADEQDGPDRGDSCKESSQEDSEDDLRDAPPTVYAWAVLAIFISDADRTP